VLFEQFHRLFSARQRAFLARHIPWTRLIYERKTTDARGRRVDLLRFIRAHRETLVIKPNRHCGGEGVSIGLERTPHTWDRLVERTLKESGERVVQEWIDNTMKLLPWHTGRKNYEPLPMYTTYGFIATPHGFGAVGRAGRKRVVNIASGGALLPILQTL
jgi:uncharacterized circularly permuted ATP-grasp superfamily protein